MTYFLPRQILNKNVARKVNSQWSASLHDILLIQTKRNYKSDKTKEWNPPRINDQNHNKGIQDVHPKVKHRSDGLVDGKHGVHFMSQNIPDEILEYISNDENKGASVEYVDLDKFDHGNFQERCDAGEIEMDDGVLIQEVDVNEVDDEFVDEFEQMKNKKGYDDYLDKVDTVEGETISATLSKKLDRLNQLEDKHDDHEVRDPIECQASNEESKDKFLDKFQEHFEIKDFLDASDLNTIASKETIESNSKTPDWLSSRRNMLGLSHASKILKPSEFKSQASDDFSHQIPVIKHTLLSTKEIISCLEHLGGKEVKLIIPPEEYKSMLGWQGLIIATGATFSHIRVLADAVVYNLRKRDLAERGVIGAQLGSEGGQNTTMSARRRRKMHVGRGKNTDDGWMAVDCRNYIVHVQDDITRKSIDLESLWDARSLEAKALRNLNVSDEEAVDEYIALYPIPQDYAESLVNVDNYWNESKYRGGLSNNIARSRNGRWAPNSDQKRKQKNRNRRR